MKWINRSHVHVDRLACPWLTTEFIDSEAAFLFVPKSRVMEMAGKTGAIPLDSPAADLHRRSDLCTCDVIVEEYSLRDKALLCMARVINAADTDRLDADPLAAGFKVFVVGYRLRYPDDLEPSSGSSKSTAPCVPGAAWRWPGADLRGAHHAGL